MSLTIPGVPDCCIFHLRCAKFGVDFCPSKFGTNFLASLELCVKHILLPNKVKIPIHVDSAILSTNCEGLARPQNLVLRGLQKIKLSMDMAIH